MTMYKTIFSSDILELDTQIEKYLNQGWKLYGNTFIANSVAFQGMIYETVQANSDCGNR